MTSAYSSSTLSSPGSLAGVLFDCDPALNQAVEWELGKSIEKRSLNSALLSTQGSCPAALNVCVLNRPGSALVGFIGDLVVLALLAALGFADLGGTQHASGLILKLPGPRNCDFLN